MEMDAIMIPDNLQRYDYRKNLICDPDNPILVQRAWRDRFSHPGHWRDGYGGIAYLARAHGEDALTWNVFRTLQVNGQSGLDIIAYAFQVAPVKNILFWGCDVHEASDVQQLLNILIRTVDGRYRGTMTEPDLVLVTESEVVFWFKR